MKWQTINFTEFESRASILIKHYRILKRLGASLHAKPCMQVWIYRLAYLTLGVQTKDMVEGPNLKIPIPFMKFDRGIILRLWSEKK